MKLKYSTRYARRHRGGSIACYDGSCRKIPVYYHIRPIGAHASNVWSWSHKHKAWYADPPVMGYKSGSSHYHAKNINHRKFRRLLKQWSKYLPPGIEFMASGAFDNLYMTGRTKRPPFKNIMVAYENF